MKKQEEVPEGFVIVIKQEIVDNEYMGDKEILVSVQAAEKQLSLPKDQRNPHWRSVKYKDAKSSQAEDSEEKADSIEIPRKRNRTV